MKDSFRGIQSDMLESIKCIMTLNSVDKDIAENNFDLALAKLNTLIKEDFRPSVTYLKRGQLCNKLLMTDDAYSDFTYIIKHCADKKAAYYERAFLNFDIANFYEAITDADEILSWDENNFDIKRIKILSMIYSKQESAVYNYLDEVFEGSKYKAIQFLFNEVAKVLAKDEYSRGLKLLDLIETIDKDNPIKLLKEATIYGFTGDNAKQDEILSRIDTVFPKYFVSHFRYTDMYQQKDLMEICFLLELSIFDKHGMFAYPMKVLEGYKNHLEGHITDSKVCFEEAIALNPTKPEGYVLLAQTLQLMSGYDNPELRKDAEANYKIAEDIYLKQNLPHKAEDMRRQIRHLNSTIILR